MARDYRVERERLLLAFERESSVEARAELAEQLCELAHGVPDSVCPEFVPIVARWVAEAEPLLRCAGLAMASAVLQPLEAKELFLLHLSDRAPRVRAEAVGRLADLADPATRGALAAALEDPQLAVRFEAARGMAGLQHPAGLEVLLEALDDAELRFRALSALAELNDPRALPAVQRLFRRWLLPQFERTQAAAVLARLGDPEGSKYLLTRAAKKWSEDRPMALELLGEVKAAGALEVLQQILARADDLCRGAAARGLGRLGGAEALAALKAALPGADDELKVDIAEGLWLSGSADAAELAKSIEVRDADARAQLDAMRVE